MNYYCHDTNNDSTCDVPSVVSDDLNSSGADDGASVISTGSKSETFVQVLVFDVNVTGDSPSSGTFAAYLYVNAITTNTTGRFRIQQIEDTGCTAVSSSSYSAEFTTTGQKSLTGQSITWSTGTRLRISVEMHSVVGDHGTKTITVTVDGNSYVSAPWSGGTTYDRTATDNAGVSDDVTRQADANRVTSDNVGVSDDFSKAVAYLRNLSGTLGVSDDVLRRIGILRSIVDNLGLSDDTLISAVLGTSTQDTLGLSDNIVKLADALRLISEDTGLSDDVLVSVSGLAEIISQATLGLTDDIIRQADGLRSLSNILALLDEVSGALAKVAKLQQDNLGLGDNVDRQAITYRILSDIIALSDNVQRVVLFTRSISDTLVLLDTIVRQSDANRLDSSLLGLDDNVTASISVLLEVVKQATLALSDSVSRFADAYRLLQDNVGLSDDVVRQSDAYRVDINNLGLSDNILRFVDMLRLLQDNIGLSDDVTRLADAYRSTENNVGLTDSVARISDVYRLVSETLGLSDNILTQISGLTTILVQSYLGLTDNVVRLVNAYRLDSSTLGLSDDFVRFADAYRSTFETLGLLDSIIVSVAAAGALYIQSSNNVGFSDTCIVINVPDNSNIWYNYLGNNDGNAGGNWSLGHQPTTGEKAVWHAKATNADCSMITNIATDELHTLGGYSGTISLNGISTALTASSLAYINCSVNLAGGFSTLKVKELQIGSSGDIYGNGYTFIQYPSASQGLTLFEVGARIRHAKLLIFRSSVGVSPGAVIVPGTYECGFDISHDGANYTQFQSGTYVFGADGSNVSIRLQNISGSSAVHLYLSSNPSITLQGDLIIDLNSSGPITIYSSTNPIIIEGDLVDEITGAGTFSVNGQSLTLQGTSDQLINPCGVSWGDIDIVKTAGNVTFTDDVDADGLSGDGVWSAGTLYFGDNRNHTWGTNGVTLDNNAVKMGSGTTHTCAGSFDYADVTSFDDDTSTLIMTGTANLVAADQIELYNLTVNNGANITLADINYTRVSNILEVYGTVNVQSGRYLDVYDGGDARLRSTGTIQPSNGIFRLYHSDLSIFETGGTLTAFTWTVGDCSIQPGTYGSVRNDNQQYQSNTITYSSGSYILNGLTFDPNDGTFLNVQLNASDIFISGNFVPAIAGGLVRIYSDANFTVDGHISSTTNVIALDYPSLTLSGSNNQNIQGYTTVVWSPYTINKSGGTVTHTTAFKCDNFVGQSGIFDPNGQYINAISGARGNGDCDWLEGFDFASAADTMNGCTWNIDGNFTANGQTLNANAPWYLNVGGSANATNMGSVRYSDASGGSSIRAYGWTNLGENINWIFGPMPSNGLGLGDDIIVSVASGIPTSALLLDNLGLSDNILIYASGTLIYEIYELSLGLNRVFSTNLGITSSKEFGLER